MKALTGRDIRQEMPRFKGQNFKRNLEILEKLELLAIRWGLTLAQLSLNWLWLWSRGPHVAAICGASSLTHWKDNQTQ